MNHNARLLAQALRTRQSGLAESLVNRQFALHPELAARFGDAGRQRCLEDACFHLSFLSDAVEAESVERFVDYLGWVKVMLAARGIGLTDLTNHLTMLREVVLEQLPDGADAARIVEHGLLKLADMPAEVASFIEDDAPHASLTRQYLSLLQAGERRLATRLVLGAVDAGMSLRDVYMEVLQRALRETGRLWQLNRISVGQEHYFTAVTQSVMAQLYPRLFTGKAPVATLVATCVAGNLHEVGVRMVADLLEGEGWNTYFLGSNTPTAAVLDTVAERGARVLAVSATIAFQVSAVRDLIARLRANAALAGVFVMVGGHAFNASPGLWREVGADGHARSADEAIALANRALFAA